VAIVEITAFARLVIILWLPGLSWILLFDQYRAQNFLETFVLSFSASLSLLSLGLGLGSLLEISSTAWVVPVCAIAFVGALIVRAHGLRARPSIPRGSTAELGLLTLLLGQLVLLLLYFWKYPIFHNTNTQDPLIHTEIVQNILETGGVGLLNQINYTPALHFIVALIVKSSSDEPLVTMRLYVIFLELMTVLLVYVTAAKLFSKKAAIIASFAYAFAIPVGVIHLMGPGTYANMLGDFQSLAAIYYLHRAVESRRLGEYVTLTLAGAGLVLSHPSSMILLTYAWMFSFVILLSHRENLMTYLKAICATTAVPAIGFFAFPRLAFRVTEVFMNSITFPTPLSLIIEVYFRNVAFFLGIPAYLIVASTFLIYCWKTRDHTGSFEPKRTIWIAFLLGWFFYVSILSIQGNEIWRLVLCSMVPGAFIIAESVESLSAMRIKALDNASNRSLRQVLRPVLVLGILVLVLATSSAPWFFGEILGPGKRERQIAIYESMRWARENTQDDDLFASTRLPEYQYLRVVAHRRLLKNFDLPPDKMIEIVAGLEVRYACVPTKELEQNKSSTELRMVFRNDYVTVLEIPRGHRQSISFGT